MSGYAYDDERTFAAMPPAQGSAFARTWWGRAWLKALEDTALDGEQLKRGRRQARAGAVGAVSVRPGRITAVVKDREGSSYRSDVLLQELSEDDWDRLLDLAVESAGHIAALLDHEMPPHLVEDAAAAGLELLPGIGDLDPECGCEAWDHCPHTTALCYQVARLLDEDPFVLLLMRGRGERALVEALQERSAARAGAEESAVEDSVPEGVPAEEAFAARDILPPLPAPPVLPPAPGEPPSLDTETAPGPGIDPSALEVLAADAAARAHRLLAEALAAPGRGRAGTSGGADTGADTVSVTGTVSVKGTMSGTGLGTAEQTLTVTQDAVRLAAGSPPSWIVARLADGSGRRRAELDVATRAWRFGGAAALAVLEEEWTPGAEALARAKAVLTEAWEDDARPVLRQAGAARWTVVGAETQLRLGEDGRWWPFRKERGQWIPAGPADQDPAAALAALSAREE
ncbi:SWF or SNF family helicase [Streptomyces sp. NPDC056463]|uniref:SWIM zinc finger family protein n=1 Tax=Streptomyces sp. NPDC056463 TaxID=3345827 RepID=UPI00368C5748